VASKIIVHLINHHDEINLWALAYTDLTSNRRIGFARTVQQGAGVMRGKPGSADSRGGKRA